MQHVLAVTSIFEQKISGMKLQLFSFLFLSIFLTFTACKKDKIEFYIEKFTVNGDYVGQKGTHQADEALLFDIKLSALDNDDPSYSIQEFEFRYRVNSGATDYVIQSDFNMDVDAFSVSADVYLPLIELPADLNNELIAGDKIDFEIWARDSNGDEITKSYQVVIE
jgi:hypothetical protein